MQDAKLRVRAKGSDKGICLNILQRLSNADDGVRQDNDFEGGAG